MKNLFIFILLATLFNACIVIESDEQQSDENSKISDEVDVNFDISEMVSSVKKSVLRIESGSGLQTSVGSGFIVSENGLVVTAEHVITNQNEITAKLKIANKEYVFEGELLFSDKENDVAIIQINGRKLSPIEIALNTDINSGSDVFSLGFPLGIDSDVSVSKGIVSRVLAVDGLSLIEHDSKIMSGNSGGPLINKEGQVLGLNVAVLTDFDTATGLNYATPSFAIMRAINQVAVDINGKIVAIPTATPVPTSTPAPTVTPVPKPTSTPTPAPPRTSSLESACRLGLIPKFTFFDNDLGIGQYDLEPENIMNLEITKEKVDDFVGFFPILTTLHDFAISADFLSLDGMSYGFMFRRAETMVEMNDELANPFDAIYIEKSKSIPNTWEWKHAVRNERTKEYTANDNVADSGTLYSVNAGPRGWNNLILIVDGNKGSFYFNQNFVTDLVLDFPKKNENYQSYPIYGYIGGETGEVSMRMPEISCLP